MDADLAAKMVEVVDIDNSSDISYEEFRRFAALLPQSQVAPLPCWALAAPAAPAAREISCSCPLQVSGSSIVLGLLDASCWIDGVEYRLGKVPHHEPLQRLMAGGIAGAFSRTGQPAPQARARRLPEYRFSDYWSFTRW